MKGHIKTFILLLFFCGIFLSGCYETDDAKPRQKFFDRDEWTITDMKYHQGYLLTDGNSNYTTIGSEVLTTYPSGKVTNSDSTFVFGHSDFQIEYSGQVVHIMADDTTTNTSDDKIEMIMIENPYDEADNTWYCEVWFGQRGNRPGEIFTLSSSFRETKKNTQIYLVASPLLGTVEVRGQFEINLK
ncbi:MAG: hypothetical protein RIC35_00200 [Marinoscillum sp.]